MTRKQKGKGQRKQVNKEDRNWDFEGKKEVGPREFRIFALVLESSKSPIQRRRRYIKVGRSVEIRVSWVIVGDRIGSERLQDSVEECMAAVVAAAAARAAAAAGW